MWLLVTWRLVAALLEPVWGLSAAAQLYRQPISQLRLQLRAHTAKPID